MLAEKLLEQVPCLARLDEPAVRSALVSRYEDRLAALVAGLTLGIPVVGAYHTEFGAYAGALSGDAMVAEVVEVAVREFYERCAAVAVPSEATALALRNRGYHIRRFEVLRNGVDRELFDPARRDARPASSPQDLDWETVLEGLISLYAKVAGAQPDLVVSKTRP